MLEEVKEKLARAPQSRTALQAAIEEVLRTEAYVVVDWERLHEAFPYVLWNSFEQTAASLNDCEKWAMQLGLSVLVEPETPIDKPSIRFWRRA